MLVLLVSDVLPPDIGGIETALSTLLGWMSDVRFIVLTRAPVEEAPPAIQDHVEIRRIWAGETVQALVSPVLPSRVRAHSGLLSDVITEWQRRHVAASVPASLVHLHSFAAFRRFAGIWARHPNAATRFLVDWLRSFDGYRHPVLFTDHSLFAGPPRQFHANGCGLLVERLPNVVCVEKSGKANVDAYARQSGIELRSWWIPNPVDTDRFQRMPLPPGPRLVVGYAGRFDKDGTENILRLAEAAPEWIDFRLALAARDGDADRARAAVSGSSAAVRWNVPNEEMPGFYGAIHVLLDPFTFGAPRTVLEALACGRAVVRLRHDDTAVPELPTDVCPVLDARDPACLFRELEAYRRIEVLERFGAASRRLAEAEYSARRVVAAYREAYRTVAG